MKEQIEIVCEGDLAFATELDFSDQNLGDDGIISLSVALRSVRNLEWLSLKNNQISYRGANALGSSFEEYNLESLLYVDLSANSLGACGISGLVPALKKMKFLKHLNLCENSIGPGGARALARALEGMSSLLHLDLYSNSLKAEGMRELVEAFINMGSLENLNLGVNSIGPDGANYLAQAFEKMGSLLQLDLIDNSLKADGAGHLAKALEKMTLLRHLALGVNSLGPEGFRSLRPALEKMTSLEYLDLCQNSLGEDGADALAPAFEKMSWLQRLDLNRNSLGGKDLHKLSKAFEKMSNLKCLYLCGNSLDFLSAQTLAKGFRKMSSLRHLDLYFNNLGGAGAYAIAYSFNMNTLGSLSLSFNKIGSDQIESLSTTLSEMKLLTQLDLSLNKIGDKGALSLSRVLPQMTSLILLHLGTNQIGNVGAEAIAGCIDQMPTFKLLSLNFSWNRIDLLSPALYPLFRLNEFYIDNNPIEPPYLQNMKSASLASYMSELVDSRIEVRHHRMVVLGASSAGKSFFVKRLLSDDIAKPTESVECNTRFGIDVLPWNFKLDLDGESREVKVEVWDFAFGQEDFHPLHPSFLESHHTTKVVAASMELDPIAAILEVRGWIELIRSCARGISSIQLVMTKRDLVAEPVVWAATFKEGLARQGLLKFCNEEVVYVSSTANGKHDSFFGDLDEVLKETFGKEKHIRLGVSIPKRFNDVSKRILEYCDGIKVEKGRNIPGFAQLHSANECYKKPPILTKGEFETVCGLSPSQEPGTSAALLSYLEAGGVVRKVGTRICLNPRWLMRDCLMFLALRRKMKNGSLLDWSSIHTGWDTFEEDVRLEVPSLLMEYDMAVEVRKGDLGKEGQWVIPLALGEWNEGVIEYSRRRRFELALDFVPPGLLEHVAAWAATASRQKELGHSKKELDVKLSHDRVLVGLGDRCVVVVDLYHASRHIVLRAVKDSDPLEEDKGLRKVEEAIGMRLRKFYPGVGVEVVKTVNGEVRRANYYELIKSRDGEAKDVMLKGAENDEIEFSPSLRQRKIESSPTCIEDGWRSWLPPFHLGKESSAEAHADEQISEMVLFAPFDSTNIPPGVNAMDYELWREAYTTLPHSDIITMMENTVHQWLGILKRAIETGMSVAAREDSILGNLHINVEEDWGGSTDTKTEIPGSDIDVLLVLNGGKIAAVDPAPEGLDKGILVKDKFPVYQRSLKLLGEKLHLKMESALSTAFPKKGNITPHFMSSKVGLTLRSKGGLVEADIIPALQLTGGFFLTLNTDGTLQYSPTNLIRIAVSQCNHDHPGLCALVRVLKLLYVEEVPNEENRVPSSLLLSLVYGAVSRVLRMDWMHRSFMQTLRSVVKFASEPNGRHSRFPLPGSEHIDVATWTTGEKINLFLEFLHALAELEPKAMMDRIVGCKNRIKSPDQK